MEQMIIEGKSIREMAKELAIPKSTLHYRLKKYSDKISETDVFLAIEYELLMQDNKNNMSAKGGKNRWKQKVLQK